MQQIEDDMYVCICNAVTERQIRRAVELGACSLADLSESLGAATGCGKCASHACAILRQELAKDPAARYVLPPLAGDDFVLPQGA